ncbi:MAG TPA: energy transducer TonB [Pseudomonadales bacterium]|jgi:protein TonB
MAAASIQRSDPADRLGFALCMALAVHALVIFGVGFTAPDPIVQPARLEVTLTRQRNHKTPDKADFIAQHNQEGSGTLNEAASLTTPRQSELDDVGVRPMMELRTESSPEPTNHSVIAARASRKRLRADNMIEMIAERPVEEQIAILERSLEIASLEARFDTQRQQLAKKPRVHRLTSVSAKTAADAEYLLYWQNRIERIGNLNYPAASRRQQIYGDLLLLVSIQADGTLNEVRVLRSSGHSLLDEAAIDIVKRSAPFAAFPPSLRQEADTLEIIRTWRFRKNRLRAYD